MVELQTDGGHRVTTPKDFWRNRKVLVTGATGLLGSWLVPELLDRGASVVVLVRDQVSSSFVIRGRWLKQVVVVLGSLTEEGLLARALSEHSIQTVFHLGAQTLVGVAKVNPVGTLEANVRGTWLLLEAARQVEVQQVVVASSGKAYGESCHLPYREDHPLVGRYPYDVSKSCTDLITAMYACSYGLPATIVRCGNLFGGGDLNFSRLIPGVIQATLHDRRFLIRSDGKFIRDFLYVEDAAAAYLWLAECMATDSSLNGEAFNFGLELRPTMLDLTEKITRMMNRSDLEPIVQNVVSAEIREQTLDTSKARERLCWVPRFTMEEGLARTIDWYREYFGHSTCRQEAAQTVAV